MISVEQALALLKNNIPQKKEVQILLTEVHQHILSKDVNSPINMPPFRQSAMDGFALHIYDSLTYKIIGEIKAGDAHKIELKAGEAVRIFTGAAVPDSANAVMQIEKAAVKNDDLILTESVKESTNIRPIGEQIKVNEKALLKGTKLNAAAIGFLAGLGITTVSVYKKPTVGILITGNELVKPGNILKHGKIYESNAIMLQTALTETGTKNINTYEVNDDFINTKNSIEKAIHENDILLISGGISVGDYDFVKAALEELQVETLFYKVNQKPGKPLFAGKINDKLVFALPGNPAASLTCYYIYVQPLLKTLFGETEANKPITQKKLTEELIVKNTRSQFLKAVFTDDEVTISTHQNSSMLNTFAVANCLVFVPEGDYHLAKNSKVDIYPI
ncbi:gephyrin-like molybdotransferase Glp [Pedobacter alpinus]|uniref:Molybdopterin molybdenumtransferase n=1 Tax=Pedobacter alpinus TaxID=1590643 RepID=A0ABW5TUJ7_9SPHI